MEIKYKKQFLKDLAKIQHIVRIKIEQFVFHDVKALDKPEILKCFSRMEGYRGYYKKRFGDYRIGVFLKGNIIEFQRALHRREIYRFFP